MIPYCVCLGMWGLTTEGTFKSEMSVTSSFKFFKSVAAETNVFDEVMSDLNQVRSSLADEIVKFNFSIRSDTSRGKRLLLLFQKDLMPGINE